MSSPSTAEPPVGLAGRTSTDGTRAGRPGLCPVRARRARPSAYSRPPQLPNDGLDDPAEVAGSRHVPNPSKRRVNPGRGERGRPTFRVNQKALQEPEKVVERPL
jgi:hypothetical protein